MAPLRLNVSVRPDNQTELGAKIEIKNLNTFSGVRRALDYEIPRQKSILELERSAKRRGAGTTRWVKHFLCDPRSGAIIVIFLNRISSR